MKKHFTTLLYIAALLFLPLRGLSADRVKVSLLTCEPGTEIYSLFGHTAIRYEDPDRKIDWVFNYGVFSFSTPNFVFRFVKGETDYQLGVVPYHYFESEYAMRGSSVYQQTLNLLPEEKQKLFRLLQENYLPENRVYRYNFFYDNCTTRARDRIEESISGKIEYPQMATGLSFRNIVHQFTDGYDWEEFGMDLCLGAEADTEITARQQMFAPFYLKDAVSKARILSADGKERPLVLEESKIIDVEPEEADATFPISPFVAGLLLFLLSVAIAWWGIYTRRVPWLWYILLFGLQGIAGCVITFLFFFSVHPTVGSNWMILLFNPLPLFYLPFMIFHACKGKNEPYHRINAVYLTLFIILIPLLPQEINLTILPLALSFLAASGSYLIIKKKQG